jgi:hypothetical protein
MKLTNLGLSFGVPDEEVSTMGGSTVFHKAYTQFGQCLFFHTRRLLLLKGKKNSVKFTESKN